MSAQRILETVVAASGNPFAALAVKATLAMLAALLLIGAARRAPASLRHLIATATFGVLLLLPLAAVLVPPHGVTVADVPASAVSQEPGTVGALVTAGDDAAAVRLAATRPRTPDPLDVVVILYLLGVAGSGASFLVALGRLHRVSRRAEVSVAGTRLANEAARREGLPGGIEVAVSTELAVPIAFGWARPAILLPAETSEWSEHELGRAVRHEVEHVARGDWAAHVVSRIALALYWPHPFAWLLWRRLRLEAERACDDAVVRMHGAAEPYAEQLVALARRLRGRGVVPALSMATRSNLGLRVDALLDGRTPRTPRSRWISLTVALAALGCVLAIGPFQVIGAPPPMDQEPEAAESDDDDPRNTALLEAAERGNLARMRRLLDQGAEADAVVPGDGSPLIAAARKGRLEAMRMLITAGADVNRGVRGDGNPLTMAAKGGHLEAVRLLLSRGADIDLGVPGDGNALIMAAGAGQIEVVRFLLDNGAALEKVVPGDENPLIHASEGGQADVVRLLIDRGADVNARVWAEGPYAGRGEWRTALIMARRNGHEEVVRILRAAGVRE